MSIEEPQSFPSDSQDTPIEKLLRGLSDGSITLKPKSPHKELNRIKGDIYDQLWADIDLYKSHRNEWPLSYLLEERILSTASKLRAYGFLEETRDRDDLRLQIARLEERLESTNNILMQSLIIQKELLKRIEGR